ncbi:AAA family ATPase [Desulfobacula phenolica]|uniref:General secretion pathway protein A n=1 Tax=Desulfobacula phenolica TaxID=90732 RepID=A0A1H2ETK8_9BACT|nr:general secretion pathway protein A [Desulfobacula phenolica]
MYKSFYNLNTKPFQISSDPAFMWFGEKHREALATLKYGILDNKGFLLLTGDVGTGKTTLINALIQSLGDDVICAAVPDPGLEKLEFFNYIAAAFGINREFSTKGAFLAHFKNFLIKASEDNKKVLLIIDEAQLLTQEMLEEIRLLSNIEKTDAKLINIFFIGQNEFNEILNREQNRAVRQRLTLNYNIDPLTSGETGEYIKHRLSVAGGTAPIFDVLAIQEIFMYSGGFPRRINVICDHCLLSGYVKEQKIINEAVVKECARELKIPAHIKNRDLNGFASHNKRKLPVATHQAYTSQLRKIGIKRRKRGFRFFLSGIVVFLLIFLVGFYLLPKYCSDSMENINKSVLTLKDKIFRVDSESYPAFTDQLAENKGEIKKNQVIRHMIKPQNALELKTITRENSLENRQHTKEIDNSLYVRGNKYPESSDNSIDSDVNKKTFPLPNEKIVIRFKHNTNDFTEEGFKQLVKFSDALFLYPETKILISGYTDSEGYQSYNQKLSEFRANIIRSFFLGRGIKLEQIQIRGLGSQNPIESNDTAQGRIMNRRVEIEIIKEK